MTCHSVESRDASRHVSASLSRASTSLYAMPASDGIPINNRVHSSTASPPARKTPHHAPFFANTALAHYASTLANNAAGKPITRHPHLLRGKIGGMSVKKTPPSHTTGRMHSQHRQPRWRLCDSEVALALGSRPPPRAFFPPFSTPRTRKQKEGKQTLAREPRQFRSRPFRFAARRCDSFLHEVLLFASTHVNEGSMNRIDNSQRHQRREFHPRL